jgi:hypothetical protein
MRRSTAWPAEHLRAMALASTHEEKRHVCTGQQGSKGGAAKVHGICLGLSSVAYSPLEALR